MHIEVSEPVTSVPVSMEISRSGSRNILPHEDTGALSDISSSFRPCETLGNMCGVRIQECGVSSAKSAREKRSVRPFMSKKLPSPRGANVWFFVPGHQARLR